MKNNTSKRWGFASYDFSNSGYVAVFQSFLFPIVLSDVLARDGVASELIWPIMVSISSVLAVVTAPFIGRLADQIGKTRVFTVLVLLTGLLAIVAPAAFSGAAALFVVSFVIFNLLFELSQSIYDSFLLNLSKDPIEMTKISSFAWGFGYLGGALFAVIYFVLSKAQVPPSAMLSIFAALFLLCSLPAIRFFSRLHIPPTRQEGSPLSDVLHPRTPVPWREILIYWVIADTVAAIMYFAPLYLRSELEMTTTMIGGVLLVGQLIAFPATILMGHFASRIGNVRALQIGLVVWGVGLVGLFLATSLVHVIVVFLLLSLVVGSTQALLRAHFAERVSIEQSAEGLGFFAIAQKSASIVAPLIVVFTTIVWDSVAPAFLVLALLIVIALIASSRLPSIRLREIRPERAHNALK